jgi:hypothetical protein
MSESKLKHYYAKMKEVLVIVSVIITSVAGLVTIVTHVYIPNSVTFEIVKYFFLVMIPITVSMIALQFVHRDVRKKLETKPQTPPLPDWGQEIGKLDERIGKIETEIGVVKRYFSSRCPKCTELMSLPIPSLMVDWSNTHVKNGAPVGHYGKSEYETACPSCKTIWHIVY